MQEYDAKAGKLVGPCVTSIPARRWVLLKVRISSSVTAGISHLRGRRHGLHACRDHGALAHIEGRMRITRTCMLSPRRKVRTRLSSAQAMGNMSRRRTGSFYHTHLCGRPLSPHRRCTLGRETSIQKVEWRDGWLYLAQGGQVPSVEVPSPTGAKKNPEPAEIVRTFDEAKLPMEFQWLRTPYPERIFSLTERPGYLRIFGRQSIATGSSRSGRPPAGASFLPRRNDARFQGRDLPACGGADALHGRFKFHALGLSGMKTGRVSHHPLVPRCLSDRKLEYPIGMACPCPKACSIWRMEVRDNDLQFFWRKAVRRMAAGRAGS